MRNIQKIIQFIEGYQNFLLKEHIFANYKDIEKFFCMGGCFMFAKILQEEFNLPIAITDDKTHCGVLCRHNFFQKGFFDIKGYTSKHRLKFHKANKKDLAFIKKEFGFDYCPFENFEEIFIKETVSAYKNNTHTTLKPLKLTVLETLNYIYREVEYA